MRVALFHPEWDRSCGTCEKFIPREDGTFVRDKRTSLPVARPKGGPTPCQKCPKIPLHLRAAGRSYKELRPHAVELSDANRKALAYYKRCRAVNRFPEDDLVEWYAVAIAELCDEYDRLPIERLGHALNALAVVLPLLKRNG